MANIDERIALEFLGWTKENTCYYDNTGHPKYEIPQYSSDDTLAFSLLKILRHKYFLFDLNIHCSLQSNWSMSATPGPIITLRGEQFAPVMCQLILQCVDWIKENNLD